MYISTKASNTDAVTVFPAETPIGMCYVPFQHWETPYAENIALERGTMFPSLDLPFCGKEGLCGEQK
ncbi:MAG: spore coat associated protein CotJA [Prevotella sp.]|nr:spore coat associated protein CotJA [Prevotella sp.]